MEIQEAVRACRAYIDGHLDDPLTPEILAARFNYASAYFRRAFHEHVGVTISRYIRIARTGSAARELLRHMSVQSAADQFGYETLSGFNRAFRRIYGVPPSFYQGENARLLPIIECIAPVALACYPLRRAEAGAEPGLALWHGYDFSGVDPRDFQIAAPEGGAEIALWAELDGERRYLFGVTCAEDATIPKGMIRYTLPPAIYAMYPVEDGGDTAELWKNINAALAPALKSCGDAEAYAPLESQPCLEYYHGNETYLCIPIRARKSE